MLTAEKFHDMSDIIEVKESRAEALVDMSDHTDSKGRVKPYTEIFNRSNRVDFSIANCYFIARNLL